MHVALATVTVADLLRAAWPQHTAKRAAAAARGSARTAEAWVAGRSSPSADTLLRMARENDVLAAHLAAAIRGISDGAGLASVGAAAGGARGNAAGAEMDAPCRLGAASHGG